MILVENFFFTVFVSIWWRNSIEWRWWNIENYNRNDNNNNNNENKDNFRMEIKFIGTRINLVIKQKSLIHNAPYFILFLFFLSYMFLFFLWKSKKFVLKIFFSRILILIKEFFLIFFLLFMLDKSFLSFFLHHT